jgi:hypothetical protein
MPGPREGEGERKANNNLCPILVIGPTGVWIFLDLTCIPASVYPETTCQDGVRPVQQV